MTEDLSGSVCRAHDIYMSRGRRRKDEVTNDCTSVYNVYIAIYNCFQRQSGCLLWDSQKVTIGKKIESGQMIL